MKILSVNECGRLDEELKLIEKHINNYCSDLEKAINVFNNDPIVQSFYASGGFGKGMEAKLAEVKTAIQKYNEIICADKGLYTVTNLILSKQLELLSSEKNGGV